MNHRFAVIDFETTGLSPKYGARITEVAVVIIEGQKIVDQYQSLVNTGAYIPQQVVQLTGITNQMLSTAPSAAKVVQEVHRFIQGSTMVAHNAAFDSQFLRFELKNQNLIYETDFICTLLLSRRLYACAESLKLSHLAQINGISFTGKSHRALADALVTAELFLKLKKHLKMHYSQEIISPETILKAQKEPLRNFVLTANKVFKTLK
jgi:DNA polymerase-3 subunit epsilon